MGIRLKVLTALAALVLVGATQAGPVSGQGTWESTLKGRDINGRPVAVDDPRAVFLYDTVLDITWLRNANASAGSGFEIAELEGTGRMLWDSAMLWVDSLSMSGFDDWRLPATLENDTTCSALENGHYFGYNCIGSEMGNLWYITLGNVAGLISNTGTFENFLSEQYWSGTLQSSNTDNAWQFMQYGGTQFTNGKLAAPWYAMAVRDGDICSPFPGGGNTGGCFQGPGPFPAPEPATLALVGAALLGVAATRRRRVNT